MLSEFSLGRSSKRNTKRAFQKLAPGTRWNYVGYMGIFCAFILLSFYCVIAGWALEFIKESVLNEFAGKSAAQISENFNGFIASGWRPVVWMGVFMLSTAFIVWSGIEKRNRTLYQDFHAGLYRPARRAGHQLPDAARRARRDRLPAASRFQQDYRRDDPQGDGPVVFLDEPRVGLHDHLRLLHPQRRKPAESGIDGGPVGYVGRNPVGYRHFPGGFFVRHQPHLGSGTGFPDAAEYFRADARRLLDRDRILRTAVPRRNHLVDLDVRSHCRLPDRKSCG